MPAKPKLTDADVKRIRKRILAGARMVDLAQEFDVNPKTISRRLVALESAQTDRDRRSAAKRLESQVARERRKLADREHEVRFQRNSTSNGQGEDRQTLGRAGRDRTIDPRQDWLDTRKNLTGAALAEARDHIRVANPAGTLHVWRDRSEIDSLLQAGWTLA